MALGDYTPTAWVNDTTPAITATTLGHIETKVDELDTLAPKLWYSSSGTGGTDGNGGQPPAPKAGGTAQGKIRDINVSLGASDCYANGTSSPSSASESWLYMVMRVVDATGIIDFFEGNIYPGNTVIVSAVTGKTAKGFAWRQS
jgi:hypothetical protein